MEGGLHKTFSVLLSKTVSVFLSKTDFVFLSKTVSVFLSKTVSLVCYCLHCSLHCDPSGPAIIHTSSNMQLLCTAIHCVTLAHCAAVHGTVP